MVMVTCEFTLARCIGRLLGRTAVDKVEELIPATTNSLPEATPIPKPGIFPAAYKFSRLLNDFEALNIGQ